MDGKDPIFTLLGRRSVKQQASSEGVPGLDTSSPGCFSRSVTYMEATVLQWSCQWGRRLSAATLRRQRWDRMPRM